MANWDGFGKSIAIASYGYSVSYIGSLYILPSDRSTPNQYINLYRYHKTSVNENEPVMNASTFPPLRNSTRHLACVANVSVWFRSKKRPWKGIFGFIAREIKQEPKNAPFFAPSLTLVPHSLLLNRTETLATPQAAQTHVTREGCNVIYIP